MNSKVKSLMQGICLLIFLTILDQISKYFAIINLKGKNPITLIPNIISLTYLENPGSAWGMLKNVQWLVVVISFVVFGIIIFYYAKLPCERRYTPLKSALLVLASGAVGNVIDRITRGVVIDFLEFEFISFPVFNIADIYVTVSVVILFILILFVYKEEDLFTNRKEEA